MNTSTNLMKGSAEATKHNYPIHNWIHYSFLGFLFAGLIISSGWQHLKKHHLLVTTGLSKEVENFFPNNDYLWHPVHHHSDILVYETFEHKNSTHPLYHFEYQTDIPLEAFLDVLDHPDQSMEWFAWVKDFKYMGVNKEELETLDILKTPVHAQMIIQPLMHLHEREFLTRVSSNMFTGKTGDGGEATTVKFTYTDLPSEKEIPNAYTKHCKDCIRGHFDMELTLVTFDEGKTTELALDLDMDLSTSDKMPQFVDHSLKMRWGEISLHKLVKRCRDNYHLKNAPTFDIKRGLLGIFPLKK